MDYNQKPRARRFSTGTGGVTNTAGTTVAPPTNDNVPMNKGQLGRAPGAPMPNNRGMVPQQKRRLRPYRDMGNSSRVEQPSVIRQNFTPTPMQQKTPIQQNNGGAMQPRYSPEDIAKFEEMKRLEFLKMQEEQQRALAANNQAYQGFGSPTQGRAYGATPSVRGVAGWF